VPPVTVSVWLKEPASAAGSDVGLILGAGLIVMLKDCVPEPPAVSFACAVKLKVPEAVGVPVI